MPSIRHLAFAALLLLPALWTVMPFTPAQAASFNCAKARLPDEITICAHRDLDNADVEMATRYAMVLSLLPMGGAGDLRDDQKSWLAKRHACGADLGCLRQAYASRIKAIMADFKPIQEGGPY